ncbi:MAG: SGNH/GDSL hydrolase family protein, partial [Acidobacteriota bacterium]
MIQRASIVLAVLMLAALPAEGADFRLLAFGDSNTFGQGDDDVECFVTGSGGYPPRLRGRLRNVGFDTETANFGLCGERTSQGVTRIESALATGGDAILIMEGTNDVSVGVGYESTVFNIGEMARKAEEAGIQPIIASVVPRGPGAGRDESNGKTGLIATSLREDAEEQGRLFADPFNALVSRPNVFDNFYDDAFHPNADGYSIVSSAFLDPARAAIETPSLCSQVPPGPCEEGDTVLCLNGGRFRLDTFWETVSGETGQGQAVPQTDDTGAFYWFSPDNIELVIKVLDGRAINQHFWVFFGALSEV